MLGRREAVIAGQQAFRKREAEEKRITEEQKEKEASIAAEQAIRERNITANREVEQAEINKRKTVEISQQEAGIIVAKKSEEQSKAEADAALARAERVKQEENVVTVRDTATAEREKQIRLIKAREQAEEEAIDVTVGAEAEKQAAEDRAEAKMTEARADAEKIRIVAEADQKRLEVEAFGEQAINEAKNLLSEGIINFELRKLIANVSPQIIEAMVKPAERIDSIKVIQTNGFGGSAGGHSTGNGTVGGGTGGTGSLPNDLTQALLNYRMQSPLVDKLLDEIGLDPDSLAGLTQPLEGTLKATSSKPSANEPIDKPEPAHTPAHQPAPGPGPLSKPEA